MKNKYQLVIFDFDGTLCATRAAISHCIKQTFAEFGKVIPTDDMIDHTLGKGITLRETFGHLLHEFSAFDTTEKDHWVAIYRRIYLEEALAKTQLYEGAKSTFKLLADAKIIINIVTHKGQKAVEKALEHFNLRQYVAVVVGDRPQIKSKPDPIIYESLIKPQFPTINTEKILMVGDTATDLIFSQKIGCHSCWSSYGYGKAEDCMPHKPHYVIENIKQVVSICN